MESFAISPPEGFEVSTDPSMPAGPYTAREFVVALTGQSSNSDVGESLVFVQVWDAPDARGISIVFDGASSNDDDDFMAGVLSAGGTGLEEFDPGVEGAVGQIVRLDGLTEHVAAWHQGQYLVAVICLSADPTRSEAVARNLTLRQSVQLTTVLGPDAKVTGLDSSDNSLAYSVGQILGLLSVVGVIVAVLYFTVGSSRRRRQQQWVTYPAGYVPPQFPSISTLPRTVGGQPPAPPYPGSSLPPPPTL